MIKIKTAVLDGHEFGEAAGGYIECSCGWPTRDQWQAGEHPVQHILEALGLTEETVWTDGGNYHVWGQIVLDGDDMYLRGSRATDAELRAAGLIKKRRWVTEWMDVTDG